MTTPSRSWLPSIDVELDEGEMLRAATYVAAAMAFFLLGLETGGAIHGDSFDLLTITPTMLGAVTCWMLWLEHDEDALTRDEDV